METLCLHSRPRAAREGPAGGRPGTRLAPAEPSAWHRREGSSSRAASHPARPGAWDPTCSEGHPLAVAEATLGCFLTTQAAKPALGRKGIQAALSRLLRHIQEFYWNQLACLSTPVLSEHVLSCISLWKNSFAVHPMVPSSSRWKIRGWVRDTQSWLLPVAPPAVTVPCLVPCSSSSQLRLNGASWSLLHRSHLLGQERTPGVWKLRHLPGCPAHAIPMGGCGHALCHTVVTLTLLCPTKHPPFPFLVAQCVSYHALEEKKAEGPALL